jgi:repressor LexA
MRQLEEDLWTDLSESEEKVLDYVDTCVTKNGLPPSRAEIARHMGYKSPNAAQETLERLMKKDRIRLIPNVSRGIILIRA